LVQLDLEHLVAQVEQTKQAKRLVISGFAPPDALLTQLFVSVMSGSLPMQSLNVLTQGMEAMH